MTVYSKAALAVAIAGCAAAIPAQAADSVAEALSDGKAYGDFRLRYESVEQDNGLDDASALTLRTKLGYQTGSVSGFSATVEMEDTRIVAGEGDYSVPPSGYKTGQYSVIADPETTELDQAFVQYMQGGVTAKLGRQVIAFDGHRHVGHVGWRQDKQTFDGLSVAYKASDKLSLNYAYINQRNRIFAEAADLDSKDHLVNASYQTGAGKLTAYSYLLELDQGNEATLDTYGLSFSGAAPAGNTKLLYSVEYATQSAEAGANEADADYLLLEGGVSAAGLTAKLGYEVLGSDDGAYGFATPLATLHKFNGWADIFLNTPAGGLVDSYVSLGGSLAGGKWALAYHDYSADDDSSGVDNYGSEVNAVYSKKFGKHYSAGVKYAAYSADELAVDTDKLWLWVGASF